MSDAPLQGELFYIDPVELEPLVEREAMRRDQALEGFFEVRHTAHDPTYYDRSE